MLMACPLVGLQWGCNSVSHDSYPTRDFSPSCADEMPRRDGDQVLFDTVVVRAPGLLGGSSTAGFLAGLAEPRGLSCDEWRRVPRSVAALDDLEVVARPKIVTLRGRAATIRLPAPEQIALRLSPYPSRRFTMAVGTAAGRIVHVTEQRHWGYFDPREAVVILGQARIINHREDRQ